MAFYRFITKDELGYIRRDRALFPHGHFPPYAKDTVVCVFESDNVESLFGIYGEALADRGEESLAVGDALIVIEIVDFDGCRELDRSQNGSLPESRVIFDPIPLEKLRIVA